MRVTTSVSPGWMNSRMVCEFGTSREGGAVAGLGADHGAARGLQRRHLGIEVLVRGRDPGIADAGR